MSSVERFNRTLTERYGKFRQLLDGTISSFATATLDERHRQACLLENAGNELTNILTDSDRPNWVDQIAGRARTFGQNKTADQAERLLKTIVGIYHKVAPIVVKDGESYDFDGLYRRLREEGRLPELFDQMIAAVQKMIETGEIDSTSVLAALERLLAILRANRNGSYVAVVGSLDYAKFIKNCCVEFLKQIPVVTPFVNAYEKTLTEPEAEQQKLEEQIRDESIKMVVDQTLHAKLKLLPNKQPLLLGPSPEDDVIDVEAAAQQKMKVLVGPPSTD